MAQVRHTAECFHATPTSGGDSRIAEPAKGSVPLPDGSCRRCQGDFARSGPGAEARRSARAVAEGRRRQFIGSLRNPVVPSSGERHDHRRVAAASQSGAHSGCAISAFTLISVPRSLELLRWRMGDARIRRRYPPQSTQATAPQGSSRSSRHRSARPPRCSVPAPVA